MNEKKLSTPTSWKHNSGTHPRINHAVRQDLFNPKCVISPCIGRIVTVFNHRYDLKRRTEGAILFARSEQWNMKVTESVLSSC
jgi:hypothetical protein